MNLHRLTFFLGKLYRAILWLRHWQPITWRGTLLLSICIVSIFWLGGPDSDLTVRILGGAGFLYFIVALTLLIVEKVALIHLKIETQFLTAHALSHEQVLLRISFRNLFLMPLLNLEVTPLFRHAGAFYTKIIIDTHHNPGQVLSLTCPIRFPHRGVWEIVGLRLTLTDRFGFCKHNWTAIQTTAIEVTAPTIPIHPLPITASSSRQGEHFSIERNHNGDYFDSKPYDASDGLSRILWKTFARSGELLVRRPEPANYPEGRIAVYMFANAEDDHVAGCLQSYLEYLEKNEVLVFFGTTGLDNSVCSLSPAPLITALNSAVWQADEELPNGFKGFLDSLGDSGERFERIVVFSSECKLDQNLLDTIRLAPAQGLSLEMTIVPNDLRLQAFPYNTTYLTPPKFHWTRLGAYWNKRNQRKELRPSILAPNFAGLKIEFCKPLERA